MITKEQVIQLLEKQMQLEIKISSYLNTERYPRIELVEQELNNIKKLTDRILSFVKTEK